MVKVFDGKFIDAENWAAGLEVFGLLTGGETPPKCKSPKYNLSTGGGAMRSVWSTAMLEPVLRPLIGKWVLIRCTGKGEAKGANDAPWLFLVAELETVEERERVAKGWDPFKS